MIILDRRLFLGATAALTMLPMSGIAAADEWKAGGAVATLPAGFDIGGGPNAGVGRSIQGPIWLPAEQGVAFSDSGLSRRLLWTPAGGYRVLHSDTNVALGTALDLEGRFVQCEWGSGTVTRIAGDGKKTVLAERFGGARLNHPFDVAIAPDGVIFFADMKLPFGAQKEGSRPRSGVYSISREGAVALCIDGIDEPGGLALSSDGRLLYVSDKRAQGVRRYAVDGARLSGGDVFTSLKTEGWMAGPQGMTTDAEGNLYVGGPGGVWVIDRDGRHVDTIKLATSRVTNLVFGGADLRTLFITSAVGIGYVRVSRKGVPPPPALATKRVSGPPLTMRQAVERLDPALDRILAPDAKLRNLAGADFLNDLGGGEHEMYGRSLEGSFWYPPQNCLLFSDIGNNRRMRWAEGKGLSFEHAPTGFTNGANLDAQGHIISCEQGPDHRVSRRLKDGSRLTIADSVGGKRFNRPNDLAIHSNGSFYVTDPQWAFGAPDGLELATTGVYHISPDGRRVEMLFDDFVQPNGIALSPDERVLYVGDSKTSIISAFNVADDGTVDRKSGRQLCDLSGPLPGRPDGISVDAAGNVYAGGSGGLWILDARGKHLGTVIHGGTQTNNMTFGGADGRTLYIVSWVALTSIPVLVPGKPIGRRA